MSNLSIYIHVPFCDHKCIYCDFYSIIKDDQRNDFIQLLKKEIKHYAQLYSGASIVNTIFFGGGTPSLLTPGEIEEIIDELNRYFTLAENAEITLETNPGTVDKEKLVLFKNAGINRLSIGVQSFDDDELKFLTRIHDSRTAKETVHYAREAGYDNISLDLIFNLPGQTEQMWQRNLEQALALPITHISTYSLILERGTILNKMVLEGRVKIREQDYDANLYEITMNAMQETGFLQYEVSNFCKSGFECRHNLAYWHYENYLGLGPSAHSFFNGKRWWNFSSLKRYESEMMKNGNAVRGEEMLNKTEMLEEYVMLHLRSDGLNLEKMNKKFGRWWFYSNKQLIEKLGNSGFLSLNDNFIKFTSKGYSLCDEILLKFNYSEKEII